MSHGGNIWQGDGPQCWQDHSANIRPDGAPYWVREAILRGIENVSYYPEPEGLRAAEGIAKYLGVDPKYVIATAGGISAIDMTAGLGGDGMILVAPCFTEYKAQARTHAIEPTSVSILTESGSFDLSRLYSCLFKGCCVWMCNPMNPSGKVFERKEILELLERIEDLDGRLIIDEAFIDYCRDFSCCDVVKEHASLIILGSLTKSLGIPGVRLGYVCAAPEILKDLRKYRRPWEVNCFAEAIALELPTHCDEMHIDAECNVMRREKMTKALKALDIYVYDSAADFVLCRIDRSAHMMAEALYQRGILVRECMDYDAINDDHHLRLAVRTEDENTGLVNEIGRILKCAGNR